TRQRPAPTFVEPTESITGAAPPRAAPPEPADAPRGPRRKWIWLAATALVVITTAVPAVVALRGEGDGDQSDTAAEPPEPAATLTGHEDPVNSVVFSPDGSTLATSDEHFSVRLWDTGTWEETATLIEDDTPLTMSSTVVAFSPDGTTLATGHQSLQLWDTGTWEETATLGDTEWITSVAFSPDGSTLATGEAVGARLWDADAGEETADLPGPADYVTSVAFSPDGSTLAAGTAVDTAGVVDGSDGGALRLWDTSTGDEAGTLTEHDSTVDAVAFSPDGTVIAACSAGAVRLWDTGTGEETATLTAGEPGRALAFSPDGSTLATGHDDGTVRLRETGTWEETATFPGEERVVSVGFSPDGSTLATGHSDGAVRLWDVG
ncbi:WD40 repeat domain-containing protein, partial [Marinitenerispora sediminis]